MPLSPLPDRLLIPPAAEWLGVAGLYAFAFHTAGSAFGFLGGTLLAVSLMLLGRSGWRRLASDPVVLVLGLLLAYLTLSALISYYRFGPAFSTQIIKSYRGYAEILVLSVAIGWWLAHRPNMLFPVLIVAVSGLMLRIALHMDWAQPMSFEWREDMRMFGMSVIHFALSATLALVGLLLFSRRFLASGASGVGLALRALALALGVAVFGYALAASLVRMAWLAFLLVSPAILAYVIWNRRQPLPNRGLRYAASLLIAGGLVGLVVSQGATIADRIGVESRELKAVATLKREDLEGATSVPIRFQKIVWGLQLTGERPFFGWGIGAWKPLGDRSADADAVWEPGDVHNLYVQILLEMGLVGAGLALVLLVLLGRGLWAAYRGGQLPADAVIWLVISVAVTAVWAMGNGKLWQANVRNPFTLLFGIAMAIHFLRRQFGPKIPAGAANGERRAAAHRGSGMSFSPPTGD